MIRSAIVYTELPEQRDRGILLQLKSTDYGHDMMSKVCPYFIHESDIF